MISRQRKFDEPPTLTEADTTSIHRAADTISRAFGDDPLITWLLKPNAPKWSTLTASHRHFQGRRLQSALFSAQIVRAQVNGKEGAEFDAGVVILHPPSTFAWWLNPLMCLRWAQTRWLDWWDPIHTDDVDPQVSRTARGCGALWPRDGAVTC